MMWMQSCGLRKIGHKSSKVAPFLENGGTWKMNTSKIPSSEVELIEVSRDNAYGWILFQRKRKR